MAQFKLNSTILVIAFKRPGLLLNLFNSLESAGDLKSMSIVIVHQIGDEDVNRLIIDFQIKYPRTRVKKIDGSDKTSTENISYNRIEGLRICFEELRADYVIALEDDVQVASDILDFTEFTMRHHWEMPRFRGVNYGSHEIYADSSSRNYARVRYGIHGPASAITINTWRKIYTARNLKRSKYIIFDGLFEYYLKTGFMITPENSRYIDLGYGGTHTPDSPENPYFFKLKSSFVGNLVQNNFSYTFNEIQHSWRSDALIYNKRENFKFQILYLSNSRNDSFVFHKIERAIYRFFILKKFKKVKTS